MSSNSSRDTIVFIPLPAMGHLVPFMELIKLLLRHDEALSISVLLIKPFLKFEPISTLLRSLSHHHHHRLHFHHLQLPDDPIEPPTSVSSFSEFFQVIPRYKQQVKEAIVSTIGLSRTLGFVLDMFCTSMMDIAEELGIPSYIYYTSGLSMLGFVLHFGGAVPDDVATLISSNPTISVQTFPQPVPNKAIPSILTDKNMTPLFIQRSNDFRKANGILVNSFAELEPYASKVLQKGKVPVYPIGPIVSLEVGGGGEKESEIVEWLDLQPNGSVVFLCFGSMGGFSGEQVKEVARGVEGSGYRFLWSLRREVKVEGGGITISGEEVPVEELPEGFLERTEGVGRVIGWAPQAAVLGHGSVGGFVSHCGWNSTLESLWCGVPMATWPMYAEQNMNAFLLARVVGLAVEVSIDYRKGGEVVLAAEVVERGIRKLMDGGGEVRERVREVREEAVRAVTTNGGSSVVALRRFLEDITSATTT